MSARQHSPFLFDVLSHLSFCSLPMPFPRLACPLLLCTSTVFLVSHCLRNSYAAIQITACFIDCSCFHCVRFTTHLVTDQTDTSQNTPMLHYANDVTNLFTTQLITTRIYDYSCGKCRCFASRNTGDPLFVRKGSSIVL